MRDFAEEVALIWAQQHAGLYQDKPEQFGRDVNAVRRGVRGADGDPRPPMPKTATDPAWVEYDAWHARRGAGNPPPLLTASEVAGIARLAATAATRPLDAEAAAALSVLARQVSKAP